MNENNETKRHYKVEVGDIVTVLRNDYGNNTFYKISVSKTNYDKTKSWFNKSIAFKKGVDIPDKTKIRILNFFEDVRENRNDKYNPIWTLFITDYELVEETTEQAISAFNEQVEISEDDLPF